MDEETECRSLYFSMDLVWIIRGFFLINHGNTHHSDTYTHYIFIDWRRDD
jgi:hypothetical protein